MDSQLHKTLQPESKSEFNYVIQHRLILYKHSPISQSASSEVSSALFLFFFPIRKSVVCLYTDTIPFSTIRAYLLPNLTNSH